MNIRVAKKICSAIGTSRAPAYGGKIDVALRRFERANHKTWMWIRETLRPLMKTRNNVFS